MLCYCKSYAITSRYIIKVAVFELLWAYSLYESKRGHYFVAYVLDILQLQ